MLFVDTGAWFALAVPSDPDHQAARRFIEQNRLRLMTTDYVVDELLTLFRMRQQRQRAVQWVDDILEGGGVVLAQVTAADFQRALVVYRQFADKLWSFTDCTSLAVMERLNLAAAFAFDEHFRQFGSINVFPSAD